MHQLIADSGSTKTDWLLHSTTGQQQRFKSAGMNPSTMNDDYLLHVLREEVAPQLNAALYATDETQIQQLTLYGAGCRPEQVERMQRLLQTALPCREVAVHSDLLGAAHALCGTEQGIICILGTGSGSAVYDGSRFVQSTPSLGYILGDEGSGASLGKHLIADILKAQFPPHIIEAFQAKYHIDVAKAIQMVYREATPNRRLAQFTYFLSEMREEASIQDFITREFELFFCRNILPYERKAWPIHFVGSIAATFRSELEQAASTLGLKLGKIVQSPLDEISQQLSNSTPS